MSNYLPDGCKDEDYAINEEPAKGWCGCCDEFTNGCDCGGALDYCAFCFRCERHCKCEIKAGGIGR